MSLNFRLIHYQQFTQTVSCNGIPPILHIISHQRAEGLSERIEEPSKSCSAKLNHLHMHQGYSLLPILPALSSTFIPLLAKASLTTSIQPKLCLPLSPLLHLLPLSTPF